MSEIPSLHRGVYQESTEDQLRSAMQSAGLTPPLELYIDGHLHRFNSGTKGRSVGDKTGWYVVYPDGVPAGRFGCWRSDEDRAFRANGSHEITADEAMANNLRWAEIRKMRDAERERARNQTSEIAETIWTMAAAASAEHPYLRRKGIQPNGARVTGDGRLVVPLYTEEGHLASLQYIDAEGGKLYHLSGQTGGCYWLLGTREDAKTIYVAEGFATAATIHEATGQPCAVAYTASNLVSVTRAMMETGIPVVVVADCDKSGIGQKYAEQAAAKYGARYVIPPEIGDANDYVAAGGDLLALLEPTSSDWLIPADEFASQPAPLQWLVRRWLPRESLAMVYGPSGGGKSFYVIDWAMRIATGGADWCGQRVTAAPVVYLAGEGHHGMRARIAAWREHHKPGPARLWISSSGCDLDTNEGYLKARDAILGLPEKPALIIVDTLHRFLSGDENSAQDARTMIAACSGLTREFGAAIILVHHTGASEEAQHRARGSSAWKGSLDVEIAVIPKDGEIQVTQRKMKDAEQAPGVTGRLTPVAIPGWLDEDGEQVTSVVFDAEPGVASAPAPKKDSKITEAQRTWSRCWFGSGAEMLPNSNDPYISRSALSEMLRSDGVSEPKIKAALDPSKPSLIGSLIGSELIRFSGHGWVAVGFFADGLRVQQKK